MPCFFMNASWYFFRNAIILLEKWEGVFEEIEKKGCLRHVDLVEGRKHCVDILSFLETLSNSLAHAIHFDASLGSIAGN